MSGGRKKPKVFLKVQLTQDALLTPQKDSPVYSLRPVQMRTSDTQLEGKITGFPWVELGQNGGDWLKAHTPAQIRSLNVSKGPLASLHSRKEWAVFRICD